MSEPTKRIRCRVCYGAGEMRVPIRQVPLVDHMFNKNGPITGLIFDSGLRPCTRCREHGYEFVIDTNVVDCP